jgi:hypothetical protein
MQEILSVIKESLTDESGKGSSPRVNSFVLMLTGIFVVFILLIMHAFGVPNVAVLGGVILTATFGKSGMDTWAAQIKSSQVIVAQTKAQTPSTATPLPTAPTVASTAPNTPVAEPNNTQKPPEGKAQ